MNKERRKQDFVDDCYLFLCDYSMSVHIHICVHVCAVKVSINICHYNTQSVCDIGVYIFSCCPITSIPWFRIRIILNFHCVLYIMTRVTVHTSIHTSFIQVYTSRHSKHTCTNRDRQTDRQTDTHKHTHTHTHTNI